MLVGTEAETAHWQLAGEHLIEHHPQRIDVRAMVHFLRMLDLLRRHIMRRAHDIPDACQPGLPAPPQNPGQPEVSDLHPALLVDHHVLRLDVAMDDSLVVGELKGFANLRDDAKACAETSFRRSAGED